MNPPLPPLSGRETPYSPLNTVNPSNERVLSALVEHTTNIILSPALDPTDMVRRGEGNKKGT